MTVAWKTTKRTFRRDGVWMRKCRTCENVLPLTDFYLVRKNPSRPTDYQYICKPCLRTYKRKNRTHESLPATPVLGERRWTQIKNRLVTVERHKGEEEARIDEGLERERHGLTLVSAEDRLRHDRLPQVPSGPLLKVLEREVHILEASRANDDPYQPRGWTRLALYLDVPSRTFRRWRQGCNIEWDLAERVVLQLDRQMWELYPNEVARLDRMAEEVEEAA